MHYYQFNIADYRKDTTHLSRLEHSIYRDLIDWCYLEETPIPLDLTTVERRLKVGSTDEQRALNSVLTDFFKRTENGYVQKRIEQEIAQYYHAKAVASKAGKASAEARRKEKERTLNARSTEINDRSTTVQPTNNHKPINNNNRQDKPSRKKPAVPFPDGFAPNETCIQLAKSLGVNWIAELPKFRDYHLQKGTLGADWNAGFRTWLNNSIKYGTAVMEQQKQVAL